MTSTAPLDFRRAMARFATGVTIVTTARDGAPFGLTVNAFTSVSLEPPLILVSLDQRSQTNTVLRAAGVFGVNILAESQAELAQRFARKAAKSFAGIPLLPSQTGVPLFADALATLECRLVAEYPGGDHQLFLGHVLATAIRDAGPPLLYYRSAFGALGAWDAPPEQPHG